MKKTACIFIQNDTRVSDTKELGYDILSPNGLSADQIAQTVNNIRPRAVVIKVGNCDVLLYARAIKGYLPDLPVILSGVGAGEFIGDKSVDFTLQSEAGEALYKILTTDTTTASFTQRIKGIVWKNNGSVITNPLEEGVLEPLPAVKLVEIQPPIPPIDLRYVGNPDILLPRPVVRSVAEAPAEEKAPPVVENVATEPLKTNKRFFS